VKEGYSTHYWGLNNYKHSQLEDTRKAIFDTLSILGEAQVDEIYDHLLKINEQEARSLYESGMINGGQKKKFTRENTMSKRTIHRHLDVLLESGLVEKINHKYHLANKTKKDIIYWSRDFGDSFLYRLMRSYYPHKFKFEQNIEEMIEIFGIYVVSCLVEASRPPVHKDGKMSTSQILNRDRLVFSWINRVFNPQKMLEYFIAIMDNLVEDNVNAVPINGKRSNSHQENASDMRYKRWMTFLLDKRFQPTSENLSFSDTADKPYYGLDLRTINKVMYVLEKKYTTYHLLLAEMTKNYDILKMTENSEADMIKRLCLDKDIPLHNH
jgi:DNA-binding transcriptional ArsR family regulator